MLDHNATAIGAEASKKLAQGLNQCDEQSLHFEWEAAVLYALSRLGTVTYEPDLGGTARLDFAFDGPTGIAFCGDVTTVTDSGVAERNPLEHFEAEVRRKARKLGLNLLDGFRMRIGGRTESTHRAEKTYLALPTKKDMATFFGQDFERFLRGVAVDQTKRHVFQSCGCQRRCRDCLHPW